MLRFLMIFGVVVVHTPPTLDVHEMDGTLWPYITSFFQNGVFLAGVPVLTVISGFLLFGSATDLKYVNLLKNKARSLLVPFVFFNLGHIALQLLLRLATGKWLGEDLFAQGLDDWLNSLFSLRKAPENEPLHFLRELIVLVVLSPLFGILIRRAPVMGFMAISLLFLTNVEGFLMNRGDMALAFYLGGLAAVYKWDLMSWDKFAYPALVFFLAVCAMVSAFQISDVTWLRLIAPVLVWPAASCLVNTRLGRWCANLSTYSFFLYLTHAPLMRICWIVFQNVTSAIPVALFTMAAPFTITALCIGLYKVLNNLVPAPLDWVLGSRSKKAQAKNRQAASEAAGNHGIEIGLGRKVQ
jgi:succinoglycan biosynthesis protein ExoH